MRASRHAHVALRALLGMAAAAATSVVLVGQFGRSHHTLDQFNALLPLLLPVLAVALAGALRLRDRATLAAAVLGLAVGGFQLGGAALGGLRERPGVDRNAPMLKIVTFSTFHANPDPGAIATLLAAQSPDIAVLQETNGTPGAVVDRLLPRHYRLASCKTRRCTLTILSRWPLRQVKVRFAGRGAHPDVLVAEVDAPFGRFRVADVHLPRPYTPVAQDHLQRVATIMRTNGETPLVVAGDFNTATGSFGLGRFTRASGLRRHDGFIPTYPANRPFAPAFAGIDHVFADSRWARAGCRRIGPANSDHYGIACRMRLRSPD